MLSRSDPQLLGHLRADRLVGEHVTDILALDGRSLAHLPDHPAIARHLGELGLGALAHVRLREARGRSDPLASALRDAYLFHALTARLFQRATECAVRRLEVAGIPYVLFKGACLARLYSDPACRPYGDVDLIVPPTLRDRAHALLAQRCAEDPPIQADLDQRLDVLGLPEFDELHARRAWLALGERRVPSLDPTDTLSVACLHVAKHGCERPIWLRDIALIAQQTEAHALDFTRFERLPDYQVRWVATVLLVVTSLLAAPLPAPWIAWASRWAENAERVASAFVAHWSRLAETRRYTSDTLAAEPGLWLRAVRDRWPDAEQTRYAERRAPAERVLARQAVLFTRATVQAFPRMARARLR